METRQELLPQVEVELFHPLIQELVGHIRDTTGSMVAATIGDAIATSRKMNIKMKLFFVTGWEEVITIACLSLKNRI